MNNLCSLDINTLTRNSRKLILTAVQILVSPHCICFSDQYHGYGAHPRRRHGSCNLHTLVLDCEVKWLLN